MVTPHRTVVGRLTSHFMGVFRAFLNGWTGIVGPLFVVAGISHWSPYAALLFAGAVLWTHDIVRGLYERADSRRRDDD